MAEENVTSGNTINQEDRPIYIHIQDIFDETYDEEMEVYIFDFYSYSGQLFSLRLRKKDIERFNLFMRKEDAHQKYFKHLIKN